MEIKKDIFRAYDIRGIYKQDLDEESFLLIGQAIGKKIIDNSNHRKVCVCMDGRVSGPPLKHNLIQGLVSMGVDVIDIGMLPTPLLYYSLKKLNVENGLMITGSHNPSSYNGIKMVINNKTLFDEHIKDLYEYIINNQIIQSPDKGKISTDKTVLKSYIKDIVDDVKNLCCPRAYYVDERGAIHFLRRLIPVLVLLRFRFSLLRARIRFH